MTWQSIKYSNTDYYNSDNEGHIFIKITNDSKSDKVLTVNKGDAFAQGIIMPFVVTDDDDVTTLRTGGIGSTSKSWLKFLTKKGQIWWFVQIRISAEILK